MQTGCKRGHWIWYVFPQLRGLGSSWNSEFYGLNGCNEAVAYLRHPLLRKRLVEITAAVAQRLAAGDHLSALMSSHVDAVKIVSSMTLFHEVSERMDGNENEAVELKHLAEFAGTVLRVADAQGYPPCRFTIEALKSET